MIGTVMNQEYKLKPTVSILEIVGNNKNKFNKKLDKNNKRLYN